MITKEKIFRKKTKKLKLIKDGGIALTLVAFFLFNSAIPVYAVERTSGNNKELTREFSSNDSLKEKTDKNVVQSNNKPQGYATVIQSDNNQKKNYTFDELNRMNYNDLVSLLKSISYENIQGLFEFSDGSYRFFNNRERIQDIINGLEDSGRNYTSSDNKGIPTLVEVLRAGYYLGYYNNQLSYLNTVEFKDKCLPAMKAIENNFNFRLGTKIQDGVVESLGRLIGNASADPEVINNARNILIQFNDNSEKYSSDTNKGNALYNILKGIDYYTSSTLYNVKSHNAKDTIFYGRIDYYMEQLERLCLLGNRMNKDNEWLVNNALYFTGRMGQFRMDPRLSQRALEDAMNTYKYLSYQYIEAASSLDSNFNGKDEYGKDINFNKIKEDAKGKYLSKTYKFDNGKFIVKAGDKVSEEKIKRLYWASKEVKAQFMRVVQNDKALEQGNPDDVLTVAIYNSPEEYKLNQKLYGYSTDNGGIYIEGVGTFFTYERTPEESIYTLEELFRHEFTHYLQARYVVPGMFGQGDFYKDGELTWYEEGTAEFFAGSTRTDGIKPRKSVAQNIAYDRNSRMSLNDLLHAKYGSWEFYHYGFAFSNYMYNNNIEMFKKMTDYIKHNDSNGYKDYIQSMSSDSNLNNKYQEYMDGLLKNLDNLNVPLVSDDYTESHPYKNINEVDNDIKEVSNIKDITTNEEKSQFFNTYDIRGTYTGSKSNGEASDWKDMNSKLDKILKDLSNKEWSGYKTVTAYFVNHKVDKDGNYQYDVVFHGLNVNEKQNNKIPKAVIKSVDTSAVGTEVKLDGTTSKDEDGQIKSYEWDFGDGTTSKDAVVNHEFSKIGEYTVKLKVTDNLGATSITSKNIKITKRIPSGTITESEPNNSYEKANQISKSNMLVKANLSKEDTNDKYYFDVDKEGKVSISMENPKALGMTWTVCSEKDQNKYVIYPTSDNNGAKEGEAVLKPGRYYINVYSYDGQAGDYTLNVNGPLTDKGEDQQKYIKEVEKNDEFETSMKVSNNSKISASLNGEDIKDVYSFDVTNTSDLNILVDNSNSIGMNWILYSEDDLDNYITYAKQDGNKLFNTYKAKPGKYYLCVYKYDSSDNGNYKLQISNK
ncbi:collagenase [Clostridium sp.]|uniref:collagenase n=1 Tax=Clostridium sp. TaxID=1506 RepID=UPI002FC7C885